MINTKLILVEGIPGSGKSTLAQFIVYTLTRQGIPCRWWYEEEKNHPVYVFHDRETLERTVELLTTGKYQQVVEEATQRWESFAQALSSSGTVVVLDGCLFGYLTWSLLPLDIPPTEISDYLTRVERILAGVNPCLIYLYQQDVAVALDKIFQRRGEESRARLIAQATESAYGEHRNLGGFEGTVAFWRDFRSLIEAAYMRYNAPKLALENSAGDWPVYERDVLDFLDLDVQEDTSIFSHELERYVGTYWHEGGEGIQVSCQVQLENNSLIIDGVPQVWPRTGLIPRVRTTFAVESLPFLVTFEEGARGVIDRMNITGPELLSGTVDCIFRRREVL